MRKLLLGREIAFRTGNHISILPFGYVRDEHRNIIFDEHKIKVAFEVFRLRFEGIGYGRIATYLNLYSDSGEPRISLVRTILTNIFYTGYIKFGDEIVKGNHQGIIDMNDFLRINNVSSLDEFKRK